MKDTSDNSTQKAVCLDSIKHTDYPILIPGKTYDSKAIHNLPYQVAGYDLYLEGEHVTSISKKLFDSNFRWQD